MTFLDTRIDLFRNLTSKGINPCQGDKRDIDAVDGQYAAPAGEEVMVW